MLASFKGDNKNIIVESLVWLKKKSWVQGTLKHMLGAYIPGIFIIHMIDLFWSLSQIICTPQMTILPTFQLLNPWLSRKNSKAYNIFTFFGALEDRNLLLLRSFASSLFFFFFSLKIWCYFPWHAPRISEVWFFLGGGGRLVKIIDTDK